MIVPINTAAAAQRCDAAWELVEATATRIEDARAELDLAIVGECDSAVWVVVLQRLAAALHDHIVAIRACATASREFYSIILQPVDAPADASAPTRPHLVITR